MRAPVTTVRVLLLGLTLVSILVPTVGAEDSTKVAHVYVALCDNLHQGIIPVPPFLGNGQDPANNLYWGARYGVKSFFRNSAEWKLITTIKNPKAAVLERCVFEYNNGHAYVVADAYDGAEIKQAITDFLSSAAGQLLDSVTVNDTVISIAGNSDLLAYVGHDGLMNFSLTDSPAAADSLHRDVIILACISKTFFADAIHRAGANPLLWTTGLMAPEAYTLKAAVEARFAGLAGETVRKKAAEAYAQYQKCGVNAAERLLVTGSSR